MHARLDGHKIVKRTAWRLAEIRRCAEWDKSSEPRMYTRTIGNGDPASIALIEAGRSASEGNINADAKPGQQVVRVISRQENSVVPGGGRQPRADSTEVLVFGGVCDRCGHPYLECRFPNGLCPMCFPSSSRPIEPLLIGHTHPARASLTPA